MPLPTSQTTQIQSVPVRFNPQLIVDGGSAQQQQQPQPGGSHQIITMQTQPTNVSNNMTSVQQQQTHTVSANKVTATVTTSARPSILRKRDIEG